MKKHIKCLVAAITLLAAASLSAYQASEEEVFHPVMRVPKLTEAPKIDGRIDEDEWRRAAAFTGVTAEGSVGGHGALVPQIQQVQWYMGYDDTYLYLAMRSPHPKGTYPVARTKEHDITSGLPQVLFEDHVEVQILTHGERDQAGTQGKGFYKIMANPKAAVVDQFMFNGTVGTEELWSMGGPLECHVTPEAWELEMAVELGRLDVETLDGRDLVIQLVRTDSCTGMYFAGWVGAPWMAWQRFARVDFEPQSPSFRFLKLGEIGAGELDAHVELVSGDKPADIDIDILVQNADGKVAYKDSKTVKLASNSRETLQFTERDIPISNVKVAERNRRNQFEIKATAKIDGKDVVLYHNRSPFMQFDDDFKEQFLDKWIAGRPQSGEWEYKIAYLPYSQKLEASVDLDFFGVPEKIQTAERFRVVVKPSDGNSALGQGEAVVENLTSDAILVDLPELAKGDYTAMFELLDANGKVISRKSAPFTRKKYEWEHNTLGTGNEVIPPFDPIETHGRQIALWGRTYHIGGNALPRQIRADAPTGTFGQPENLLAAPVRFEITAGGEKTTATAGQLSVDNAAMHRVDMSGTSSIGPVTAKITSFVEYDGWYETEAKLTGNGTIQALDLIIDLDDRQGCPMDTLYVQRLGDGRRGNHFSAIPESPGIHFKSTELLEYRGGTFDWKSFVPRTFIGNGDRGLWFFAWSATGWELREDQPVVQVERLENGDVRLRVRILAGPVEIDGTRTVRFALQATPAKPNHPRYRTYNEESIDAHDTRGYRYFGKSVDGFVNYHDNDFEALRKFLLYGTRYQTEEQRKAPNNYNWWKYDKILAHGAKLIMYGSGQLMGMGAREFKTFGGEWLGKSNWQAPRNSAPFNGRWNYQGTEVWDTDEELSVTGVNWSQSMIDFFVWYHKPLMEKAGFNGTWWDNTSMGIVREYNPELDRMEEVWLLYPRRQLIKRLHVLGWELMRPPLWASNMHVDLGLAEIFWMVENDWYADGPDMTSLDQWSMGMFRAMARTKSTMQVARPWLSGFRGTTPEMQEKVQRSLVAMLLSHDIHPNIKAQGAKQKMQFDNYLRTMNRMRGLVNLSDTQQCLFAGYWLTEDMVQAPTETIHASVYTNTTLGTAAVVLFNTTPGDRYLAGTKLDINKLVPVGGTRLTARRIFDLETGETVATTFENEVYVITEPLTAKGENFRLLGIEVN